MHEIIPGILEKDWSAIEQKIDRVRPFAKTIHIDLIDGVFAPNTTFLDPEPFKKYTDDFLFEVHLMVDEPEKFIEAWSRVGFRRFLGHVEKMSDQVAFVAKAQEVGEVGLALDGNTDISQIKINLQDLDSLLIMTINAGFSGQEFEAKNLDKVKELSQKTSIPIGIDGGITPNAIEQGLKSGATRFVSTSYLFSGDSEGNYKKLREA